MADTGTSTRNDGSTDAYTRAFPTPTHLLLLEHTRSLTHKHTHLHMDHTSHTKMKEVQEKDKHRSKDYPLTGHSLCFCPSCPFSFLIHFQFQVPRKKKELMMMQGLTLRSRRRRSMKIVEHNRSWLGLRSSPKGRCWNGPGGITCPGIVVEHLSVRGGLRQPKVVAGLEHCIFFP